MKKLLSLTLSLILLVSVISALPFNALAAYSLIDTSTEINITTNFKPGDSISPSGFTTTNNQGYNIVSPSASATILDSSTAATTFDQSNSYYKVTYGFMIDSHYVSEAVLPTIYLNGYKISKSALELKDSYSDGSAYYGSPRYVRISFSVYFNNVTVNGECIAFSNYGAKISITAPDVEGKHFVKWTGTSYPYAAISFDSSTSRNTNMTVGSQKNTVTPNYEAHNFGTDSANQYCSVCHATNPDYGMTAEQKAEVTAVKDKINALPNAESISLVYKAAVEEARAAYDALNDKQKAAVESSVLKKLTDAETAIKSLEDAEAAAKDAADTEAADGAKSKIDTLPAADKITTAYKAAVEDARKAYDALTDAQKAKVSAETLKKLTDAETALAAAIKAAGSKNTDETQTTTSPVATAEAPASVTTLTLKKAAVKKSAKKLVLQATLKVDGKAVKGKKITFKFNGKKYTAKTNAKGIAKVTIKKSVLKKLKKGKKITIQATYGKSTAKRTVKVK